MKKGFKSKLVIFTILAMLVMTSGFPLTAANADTTRDPAFWPFSSTSPWNMPLGSGATYAAINSPVFKPASGAYFYLQSDSYSHPVFIGSASDPLRTITRYADYDYTTQYNPPQTATVRIPTYAMPAGNTDQHMHVIDENHTTVTEGWLVRKTPGQNAYTGNFDAIAMVQNSLTDNGVYSSWHGVRAYGGSVLGGLIRKGELTNGIPHAVALIVSNNALNKNGPSGNPYVWPASSADSNYASAYGSTGNIYMGSLLAIPMSVDLSTLGLSTAAYNFAYALQHYGGYIVDTMGPGYNSCYSQVEIAAQDEVDPYLGDEIRAKLASLLKVVTNNSQSNVGGPGTRVAPTAPPMAVPSPVPAPTPIPTAAPASGWVNVEDTDPGISYVGNAWGTFPDYRYTSGTAHYNNGFDTSQYCQFTFSGTQAKIYGTKYSGGGVPDIYVDNVKKASPNLMVYPRQDRQLIYDTGVLSNGSHTVKIKATNNGDVVDYWFNLDYYTYNSNGSTPTPTPTRTPTPTPTSTPTPAPTPTPTSTSTIYIGEQSSNLSSTDYNAGNMMVSQNAVLSQTAAIQSLSLYVVTTGSGNLRLGIYDSTGPNGGPGALKAATDSFAAKKGWNTKSVVTPVSLSPGTYWIAALPSTNSMVFKADWSTGVLKYYSYTFGAMPGTFSTAPSSDTGHWAFYATLTP